MGDRKVIAHGRLSRLLVLKQREPVLSDELSEKKLLRMVEDHHLGFAIDGRNEEIDKLVEHLEFYRQPTWKKAATYVLKGCGLLLGFLVILGLLGVGNWF